MLQKKFLIPFLFVILASTGLIAHLLISQTKAPRRLSQNVDPIEFQPQTKRSNIPDLSDKKVVEEILRKIEQEKAFYPEVYNLPHDYFEKELIENDRKFKEKYGNKNLRKLAENNAFDDVAIVDPLTTSIKDIQEWLASSIKQYTSNIVLYPYNFNYNHELNGSTFTKNYEQGGYISLNPKELDAYKIGLKTSYTLEIKKARALYDADIAILSINGFDLNENITDIDYFTDGTEWSSFIQKYLSKGNTFINYETFMKAKRSNPQRTYSTLINETEIQKGGLMNEQIPRFGILIIPDFYISAKIDIILGLLKQTGIDKIKEFYENGGVIFANGKSGALLEEFGLVQKNTYDRTLHFFANGDSKITSVGCESTYNKSYVNGVDDFDKQMACVTIDKKKIYTLTSSFKTKTLDTSFKTLVDIDSTNTKLQVAAENGIARDLTEEEKKILPLVLHKNNNKGGQIFIMNFNPMGKSSDRNLIFNLVSLSLSKELYITSSVRMTLNETEMPDLPIPAGEAGFNLKVDTLIHNLDDQQLKNAKLYLFIPDNFDWSIAPSSCTKKDDYSTIPSYVLQKKNLKENNTFYYCPLNTIDKFEKRNFDITILVLNYKATQMKYSVLILESILEYTDSKGAIKAMADYVKVNCEAAALLRCAINPDPSSFYPVKGEGQYIDNVVKVENKEQTDANEVEYYGLIPLISPLTDGDDQRVIMHGLKILPKYYHDNKFEVPFTTSGAQDFIYSGELSGKGVVMVAEWDSPVLPVKEIITPERVEKIIDGSELDLNGINIGMITINKTSEILKQINYRNSDRFYKLASQRLMVYVDDSTPKGAKTLHEDYSKIPTEWQNAVKGDRARREFIFTRSDIYFYDNENYVNPETDQNIEKVIFSLDKYKAYKKGKSGCADDRGDARSQIDVSGYFTDKNSDILKYHLWTNEMFEYCDLTVIDPTNENEIKKYFGDTIKPIHYLIPNVDTTITRASEIYGFQENSDKRSGYHKTYPSIKFLYVHNLHYKITASTCIYGGKIIIDLSSYKYIVASDITISPDQIAVYHTEIVNNQMIAYFRRGLMSNEQFGKDLKLEINIENINVQKDIPLKVTLYEMKYDISYPPTYERYYQVNTTTYNFKYQSAWSFPAIEIKAKLNRTLNGYETMEPFSRYGVYIQEINHRTVWGTAETHQQTSPGIVASGASFSLISNLGISSIPFIEYLTVGRGQVIPAGPSTSRVSWKDIWGRIWHQPLRSVFPDVPPIPPPLKNFMMTTTYEVLQNGKQIYEWPSDEKAQIRLHIKLLNNYPKYFEITRCRDNQIRFVPQYEGEDHSRVYDNTCPADLKDSDFVYKSKVFLNQGGFASYGKCFLGAGTKVGGKNVEGDLKDKIKEAILCADLTNADKIKECEERLKDITTLTRYKSSTSNKGGKDWNYAPLVEQYYPKGYIEDDMWDLTHVDYDDNNMDKAYKYHMDNHVPNYDNSIKKPHNIIAVPIYKGLGYNITYDKNNQMNYHGTIKKGWWSDDLQNKDNTLVAGQDTINTISVDKKSLITNWVEGKDLKGHNDIRTENIADIVNSRNKNIYVCLFNRFRPEHNINSNKKYFTANVNRNNIVPVIVDLDADDYRLTNYPCGDKYYTPENIYQEEGNYLETPTSKDYLYFAANLRGEAKESFNVLMNLNYFDRIKYEGMVKVNEGGRFTYWNPANGPNSFLIVDDPVSIVNAKRNDIDISNNIFPSVVATFNSVVYHAYFFKDELKINKQWPFTKYYTNSYGFGDVAVSVYVGGIRRSKAVLEPGQTTYARIIFYNNCGFDWNMKGNAIDFEYKEDKPISANDLLSRITHTIQAPLSYNFFKYSVSKDYEKFITIEPSDHNIYVAPEFFDFENINVVTIRDGFKGEYNLKINVTSDFPDELRGKPIEIKIDLNTSYFDKFPGTSTDPIKSFHNYKVKVPSVYIGVPYNKGPFAGKVLYTSAQATDLDYSLRIFVDWKVDGIKYVDKETLSKMYNATEDENANAILKKLWDGIKSTSELKYSEEPLSPETKLIKFDFLKTDFKQFPKIVKGAPDIADVAFLVKSNVSQLKYGRIQPIDNVKLYYKQWNGKTKNSIGEKPFIEARGPWINLNYKYTLVDLLSNGTFIVRENQEVFHDSEGYMRIYFNLKNDGNEDSFNTRYEIIVQREIDYVSNEGNLKEISIKKNSEGQSIITFDLNRRINKGDLAAGYIYVFYHKYVESVGDLEYEEVKNLPKMLNITKESSAIFDLTQIKGENEAVQHLRKSLSKDYTLEGVLVYIDMTVSGRKKNPGIELVPKIKRFNESNIDLNQITVFVEKKDLTSYNGEIIKDKIPTERVGDIGKHSDSFDDKPNTKQTDEIDQHKVSYNMTIYVNGEYRTCRIIEYDQKEIGISPIEIGLLSAACVLFILTGVFIFLGIRNLKNKDDLESEVKSAKIYRLIDE